MCSAPRRIPAVPHYALYEEPALPADAQFIHVEPIARRSAPRDWTIRSHAHGDLHQLLLIAAGGGTMQAEAERLAFGADSVLVMPAGMVHAFRFEAGTQGQVVSIANPLLQPLLADPPIAAALAAARVVPVKVGRLAPLVQALSAELAGGAPGRSLAAEAWLRLLLVHVARALAPGGATGATGATGAARPGRHTALVARFRAQLEARLAEGWSVRRHADALGVSVSSLRAACTEAAGTAPIRLIRQRTLTEARRLLAHRSLGVAEIGYALGFTDPAYFSRWFRAAQGCPPGNYRDRTRT